ncbi:VanW domain-containing protein [Leuconostoc litchii]|uniref:Vancomycin resistance protein n=1 Tax=Leuconostoc litchii TaxID=1981069 RepID=A0A6P2CNT2_9LACO|nr:VanW family protein [Leuconostoc litchii]TYC47580.1 vancomycin resistance protein [Leuconostoc litchii]GMA69618.1 VanW domain-containing protein [Leuconostoc litchii]
MTRKLFCEISPLTYKISYESHIIKRKIVDIVSRNVAKDKYEKELPYLVFKHESLMRRRLRKVPVPVEEAKVNNLKIAAPKVSHILIKPGETFSFWNLVGRCTVQNGYQSGLMVANDGQLKKGTGGGLCQFSNLIHWMILHSSLDVIEKYHHEQVDMFPDSDRQVPFGSGTSIVYNYLDYRFKNNTEATYQLITYVGDKYLHGELRMSEAPKHSYEVKMIDEKFIEEGGQVYRCGKIYQYVHDDGKLISKKLIKTNHARVAYDTSNLKVIKEASE